MNDSSTMYLKEFKIQGFRSCEETVIEFNDEITVIIGENNSGKSNIIEALRLMTTPLSGRKTRYFESNDFRNSRKTDSPKSDTKEATMRATFADLRDLQCIQFLEAANFKKQEAVFTKKFDEREGRIKSTFYVSEQNLPCPDRSFDQIKHIFFPTLRDANKELDTSTGKQLLKIMRLIINNDTENTFKEIIDKSNEELTKRKSVDYIKTELCTHLGLLTEPVRKQEIDLNFREGNIERLVRSLNMRMGESQISLADIADSGFGYANLLYLACIILELSRIGESELTLFLIEEPEAHLHPQLQKVLIEYLKEKTEEFAKKACENVKTKPAGRLQVIITTHSSNIANNMGIKHIVVARNNINNNPSIEALPSEPVNSAKNKTLKSPEGTVCTRPIEIFQKTGNKEKNRDEVRRIDMFLDVTRTEMLFARKVILVEGLSEQILLPALAKHRDLYI